MHIRSVQDVTNPGRAPWGETVFELVGRALLSGGTPVHSLAYITIDPGKASTRHFHKKSEETYYILSGKARVVVNGQSVTLSPGQAILLQPPETHQIFNAGDDPLAFLAVCVPAWEPGDSYEAGEG